MKFSAFTELLRSPEAEAGTADPAIEAAAEAEAPASAAPAPAPAPAPAVIEPPAPAKPVKKEWQVERIAELTAKLHAAKADLTSLQSAKPAGEAGPSESEIERMVEQRASAKASQDAFTKACMDTAELGRQKFPDFGEKVNLLKQLNDENDPVRNAKYAQFIAAAIETGEGAKVIHTLGGDLDEAARIMGMSPTRIGVELTKLALANDELPSTAPKPITPLGSKSASFAHADPSDPVKADSMDIATWMQRRNEQVEKSEKTRRR